MQAKVGPSVLIHREANGLSAPLLTPEQGIPVHRRRGQEVLADPSKDTEALGAVLVRVAAEAASKKEGNHGIGSFD